MTVVLLNVQSHFNCIYCPFSNVSPKSRISQLLGQNNDLKITQQYKISTYTEL